jgi:hypothetical protein
MASVTRPDVRIQVKVAVQTKYGRFHDSLYYSLEEFEAIRDEDVDAAAQARADVWVAHVDVESARPPPSIEERDARLAEEYRALLERGLALTGEVVTREKLDALATRWTQLAADALASSEETESRER